MFNKIVLVLMSSLIGASAMANSFEKELGREVTAQEAQQIEKMLSAISAQSQQPNFVLAAAPQDNRTIGYNMACLTAKGAATGLVGTNQKIVCVNIYGETFTISRSTSSNETTVFSFSAAVGVLYVRMHVNESVYNRLQSLQLIEEPVDAIGVDLSKGLVGAQILFLSSPNVSLKMGGWLPGYGGGINAEQNGNVDRSTFQGSMVTVKKFNW